MDSIIQVVVDAAEKNPPHASKADVARDGSDLRLRGDQLERSGEFIGERAGRICTILAPPASSFLDVP